MPQFYYDHLHLVSTDPIKSAHFYESVFGAVITSTRHLPDGRINVELDLGGWRFMLIDRRTPEETVLRQPEADCALGHVCFRTDDVPATRARLQADGIKVSEIKSPRRGVNVVFLHGPDNVIIELTDREA